MCVAIVQPKGFVIPAETLSKCFRANAHGGGLAFVRGNEVVIKKGFMKEDQLIEAYNMYRLENPETPFLVHCRIATKGVVGETNCHPFKVKGGVMIHNGTLWHGGLTDEKSDTREFAETLHNNLHKANMLEHHLSVGNAINGSRMAFLYKDGTTVLVNDRKPAVWIDGIWYSNDFWQYKR